MFQLGAFWELAFAITRNKEADKLECSDLERCVSVLSVMKARVFRLNARRILECFGVDHSAGSWSVLAWSTFDF